MDGFFPSSQVHSTRFDVGLVPKCGACGLYKKCQSPKMKPYGEGDRKVLIIGEAPGETEDERGRPFIGKAGQFLRDTLEMIGVDLDQDCLTTNALICRPPHNETPTDKQIGYCRPNLYRTMQEFKPKVIITLGRPALASVIEQHWRGEIGAMARWVGWRIPIAEHWICPTYHPSYLLRSKNPVLDRAFANHLRLAFKIKRPPAPQEDYKNQIEVILEEEKAMEAIRYFHDKGGWLSFDYETNCLKPEYPEAAIFSCGLSNGERTVAYPWWGNVIEATRKLLLHSDRTMKISSNIKMEERWTRKVFGRGVKRWGWDVMLAAHCLDNRQGICSLKFQALTQLGVVTYNQNIEPYLKNHKGHYNRIKEIELKTLLFYNGMDAIQQYQIAEFQRRRMGYED